MKRWDLIQIALGAIAFGFLLHVLILPIPGAS